MFCFTFALHSTQFCSCTYNFVLAIVIRQKYPNAYLNDFFSYQVKDKYTAATDKKHVISSKLQSFFDVLIGKLRSSFFSFWKTNCLENFLFLFEKNFNYSWREFVVTFLCLSVKINTFIFTLEIKTFGAGFFVFWFF